MTWSIAKPTKKDPIQISGGCFIENSNTLFWYFLQSSIKAISRANAPAPVPNRKPTWERGLTTSRPRFILYHNKMESQKSGSCGFKRPRLNPLIKGSDGFNGLSSFWMDFFFARMSFIPIKKKIGTKARSSQCWRFAQRARKPLPQMAIPAYRISGKAPPSANKRALLYSLLSESLSTLAFTGPNWREPRAEMKEVKRNRRIACNTLWENADAFYLFSM